MLKKIKAHQKERDGNQYWHGINNIGNGKYVGKYKDFFLILIFCEEVGLFKTVVRKIRSMDLILFLQPTLYALWAKSNFYIFNNNSDIVKKLIPIMYNRSAMTVMFKTFAVHPQ